MDKKLKAFCDDLTALIQASYEEGVTMEAAERIAGKFLHAQLMIADALKNADLDARMKKSGVKAIRAAIYMEGATGSDKKPSDVLLGALVDQNKLVQDQQSLFDEAEVSHDGLNRYYSVFREAHIHFRGIAKGKYE